VGKKTKNVGLAFGLLLVALGGLAIPLACEESKSCVAPQVVSVSPVAGAEGAVTTVTGCGFGALACLSYVAWNGVPGEVRAWSDGRLEVAVPSGAGVGAKTMAVVVGGKVLATTIFDVTAETAQVDAGLVAACDAGAWGDAGAVLDAGGGADGGADGGQDGGADGG
jgi:hypothetical protein